MRPSSASTGRFRRTYAEAGGLTGDAREPSMRQRKRSRGPRALMVGAAESAPESVAELVEFLARQLVDDPDAVRVEQVDEPDALVLRLHVAPDDVGKVIGRQGRIARALRAVVRAAGSRERRRVLLEIVD